MKVLERLSVAIPDGALLTLESLDELIPEPLREGGAIHICHVCVEHGGEPLIEPISAAEHVVDEHVLTHGDHLGLYIVMRFLFDACAQAIKSIFEDLLILALLLPLEVSGHGERHPCPDARGDANLISLIEHIHLCCQLV